MYKIYINERPLILCQKRELDDLPPLPQNNLKDAYLGQKKLLAAYTDLLEKEGQFDAIVLFTEDVDQLYTDFKKGYKFVEAAGGLVKNESGEYLIIKRLGYWDLPKGKLEKGESPEETALREVEEETSVNGLELGDFIMHTYHTYRIKKKRYFKKTYWYRMYADTQELTPQVDEAIELCDWIEPKVALQECRPMYENIKDVISSWSR